MARRKLTDIERTQRAQELAEAFTFFRAQPGYDQVIDVFYKLMEEVKGLAIVDQDPEGVRWYQAEWAVLDSIVKALENGHRTIQQPEAESTTE